MTIQRPGDTLPLENEQLTIRERQDLIREIGKRLFASKSVWIFCHENPDGDTLGCSLATYGVLVQSDKEVRLLSEDPIPRMYSLLPHANRFDVSGTLPEQIPDIILVNDNASFERLGRNLSRQLTERGLGPYAKEKHNSCIIINVDHHFGNEYYGDINLIDTGCGACGELVYYMFQQLMYPITLDVATNLYAAILTDSGRFSYANTSEQTFNIANNLIRLGVSPFKVVNRVYNTRSPEQIKLLARILDTIAVEPDLGYFYCYVNQKMLREANAVLTDSEGAVDMMKTVGGFDLCFFLKEELDGKVKVSVRSNTGFNVNQLARRFGGGGHPAASGFRIDTTIDKAPDVIRETMLSHPQYLKDLERKAYDTQHKEAVKE